PTLIGLLSQCDLLLTNDSGPMHLAAALDTPQIALLGSTDEVATGPFSPRAQVIHKHVECSPCLLRECPIDLRCFSRIEVEEVYESARAILQTSHLSGS
ncbi:MAG: glycosyltransferase family 9 protein, partial [Acidobacteria bacterium]|nr:glycosyltransferase family 9 protein [Acidobacteriota bacterium]